ncbi:MAG: S9 family peptidase [Flavobacteriaceae bacterium]
MTATSNRNKKTSPAAAPVARRSEDRFSHHGIERHDPYHWLRADNWQEVMRDPSRLPEDIRAYLEGENAYADAMLEPLEGLRETLFAELKGRIPQEDASVPTPDGPYQYGVRYVEGGQHPRLTRGARGGGAEIVLLDGDREAEGKRFFRLGGAMHSPDHRYLAWASDDSGSEFYTLRIRDLETGEDLPDAIPDTGGGGVWSAGSDHVFYVRLDPNHRPCEVWRHRVGTKPDQDVLVYREADPGMFMGIGKTQSGRFIIIDVHDHETGEVRLIPAEEPTAEPLVVAAREPGVEYGIDEADGTLFIRTNADGAEDFKIMTAPADAPGRENWRDLIAHVEGRYLLQVTAYRDHLVWMERVEGLPRIVIRRHADGVTHAIAFTEEAYALGLSDGYEFDTNALRFSYSSMTTPSETYDYDVATRERTLRKRQEVPSGHDPEQYETRRVFAKARDGETIPVTLLHRKDTPLDGSAPCLLYGYGSYGITIPAGFNPNALSLADRGFVYAVAHIRGGRDKGQRWYREGKREKKVNTFTDFLDAADYLAGKKIVDGARIIAQGGSAGGMLMGVVANMAPERFAGIIAEVPFVDVLSTMLDDTLPLTPPEWPEWGNPIENQADYKTIAAYSPYENIVAKDYPAILAVAGLTDPRVTYWEPAKWVAKLRGTVTNSPMILLKTNMEAGHAGASGRFDRLKEVALNYAFALMIAGKA